MQAKPSTHKKRILRSLANFQTLQKNMIEISCCSGKAKKLHFLQRFCIDIGQKGLWTLERVMKPTQLSLLPIKGRDQLAQRTGAYIKSDCTLDFRMDRRQEGE